MKQRLSTIAVGFALVMGLLGVVTAAGARVAEGADVWNSAEISWRDVPTGIKEATASGKPVLMVMHALWCPACRRYREVFKDSRIVAAARDIVMILVDVEKYPDVNGGFAPDGTYVPRTLFLDAQGNIDDKLVGSDPAARHNLSVDNPNELLALMRRAQVPAPPLADENKT